jgi:hypothetical protein
LPITITAKLENCTNLIPKLFCCAVVVRHAGQNP